MGGENFTISYFETFFQNVGNKIIEYTLKKANYHLPNSYRSISISNFLVKIYEKIIQQEAINVLTENNFFDGKNVFAYQKNKNSSQAILPLIEQMLDAISSGKYGIAVMTDLEGAFDTVWREGAI